MNGEIRPNIYACLSLSIISTSLSIQLPIHYPFSLFIDSLFLNMSTCSKLFVTSKSILSTFTDIPEYSQSSEKSEEFEVRIPSYGLASDALSLQLFHFSRGGGWTVGLGRRTPAQRKTCPLWGQFIGVRIPTLAPVTGATSSRLRNSSFSKMFKITPS